MEKSFFNRLYSYTERENKNSKENYLIEIFAFCLEIDNDFFNEFLGFLGISNFNDREIWTQKSYSLGRPDIEIFLPDENIEILIECKIEHFERENQLIDYAKILINKESKNKHLIYLTKYYENKLLDIPGIIFHKIRWCDIFQLLNNTENLFSLELQKYLKKENMAEQKNFNYTDLSMLYHFPDTISKMDEVIDSISDYYKEKIGPLSKESSRSTRLKENWYTTFQWVENEKYKICYQISLGFYWWWGDGEIYTGIRFWLQTTEKYKNCFELKEILLKSLKKDWEFEDENKSIFQIGYYKKLSEFIVNSEEQLPDIYDFLKKGIDQICKIKTKNKKYFK
jgi:hypothetical protein